MKTTLSHGSPVPSRLATADGWPNPWSMYAVLRDHDPVHHVVPPGRPAGEPPARLLGAVPACQRVECGPRNATFSSAHGLTVNYGELEIVGLQDNPPFVMQDPPVHTEFRKLVSRGFTPRQWGQRPPVCSHGSRSPSCCPDFSVDESGIFWAGSSYVRRPLSVPFRVTG